jgi:2-polyprenyl-3-methyl-5-hydroxy-6-metoxy-1,4-benzoquinol methylase
MKNSDNEWEKFGKDEPYYSIKCSERFRKKQLDENSMAEFFKSGEDFIKFIFESIKTYVDPSFSPRNSLDFGCGVGRCSIPLAKICPHVVGADVSESMLKEAKKNSQARMVSNLDFIKSDDSLSQIQNTFDLIISFEVFHNIPNKRGYKIFKNLIDHVSENGVLAIDFLFYKEGASVIKIIGKLRKIIPLLNNIVNLILGRPIMEPFIEKNPYDINKLLYISYKKACHNIHVEFFSRANMYHIFLFSQKTIPKVSASKFL